MKYQSINDKRIKADFTFSNNRCIAIDYYSLLTQTNFSYSNGIPSGHGRIKHGWTTHQYNHDGTISEVVYNSNINPLMIERHYYSF